MDKLLDPCGGCKRREDEFEGGLISLRYRSCCISVSNHIIREDIPSYYKLTDRGRRYTTEIGRRDRR